MSLELPPGWQRARVDELCAIGSGGTPRRSEPSYFGGPHPWITISDLNDGIVTGTAETVTDEGISNSAAKLIPERSVLIALYGSIGKAGITSRPSTTNQAIAHALPNDEAYDARFLFHYMQLKRRELSELGTGVTQKNIYLSDIKSFDILVAPRAEQTRIVEKLEELLSDLDAGVAELRAAQSKLAQYRQSLLKAAMEGALTADWRATHGKPRETGAELLQRILSERRARWEQKQLAKFAEQGKAPPKGWQAKYSEPVAPDHAELPPLPEGWVWASLDQLVAESSYGTSVKCGYESSGDPILRIPNVSGGKLDLSDIKFATESLNLRPEDHLAIGDVLVIRTNGSIGLVGRAAVVSGALPASYYFASYLLRLRCVETSYTHRWIFAALASHSGRRWIEARAASSAGQHNISLSTLLTMPLPLPPLAEQADALNAADVALESAEQHQRILDKSLAQTAAQRKNILKAAFAGRLIPQNPNDEPASELLARIRAARASNDGSTSRRRRKTA